VLFRSRHVPLDGLVVVPLLRGEGAGEVMDVAETRVVVHRDTDRPNSAVERFARAGHVVNGLLHLAIGYLGVRIALGAAAEPLTSPVRSRRSRPNRVASWRSRSARSLSSPPA